MSISGPLSRWCAPPLPPPGPNGTYRPTLVWCAPSWRLAAHCNRRAAFSVCENAALRIDVLGVVKPIRRSPRLCRPASVDLRLSSAFESIHPCVPSN